MQIKNRLRVYEAFSAFVGPWCIFMKDKIIGHLIHEMTFIFEKSQLSIYSGFLLRDRSGPNHVHKDLDRSKVTFALRILHS